MAKLTSLKTTVPETRNELLTALWVLLERAGGTVEFNVRELMSCPRMMQSAGNVGLHVQYDRKGGVRIQFADLWRRSCREDPR